MELRVREASKVCVRFPAGWHHRVDGDTVHCNRKSERTRFGGSR